MPVRRWFTTVALAGAVAIGAGCAGTTGTTDATGISGSVVSGTTVVAPLPGTRPQGFTTITARITDADGKVCEVCLWLADSADERGRGLMGVTDLGEPVGMAFRWDAPVTGAFYMFQTPTPLSIAWFAPDGAFLDETDMAPCLDTPAEQCSRFSPDAPYTVAIEAFEGGLDALGIGAGSTVELLADTEGVGCPLPH